MISIPSCSTNILTISVWPFQDASISAVLYNLKNFQILFWNIKYPFLPFIRTNDRKIESLCCKIYNKIIWGILFLAKNWVKIETAIRSQNQAVTFVIERVKKQNLLSLHFYFHLRRSVCFLIMEKDSWGSNPKSHKGDWGCQKDENNYNCENNFRKFVFGNLEVQH